MIINIVKIAVGLLMMVVVLIGYLLQPEYLVELTSVSNTFDGLLLLADGILNFSKKEEFPPFFLSECCSKHTYGIPCLYGKSD